MVHIHTANFVVLLIMSGILGMLLGFSIDKWCDDEARRYPKCKKKRRRK